MSNPRKIQFTESFTQLIRQNHGSEINLLKRDPPYFTCWLQELRNEYVET
jgi:hypothetical protein